MYHGIAVRKKSAPRIQDIAATEKFETKHCGARSQSKISTANYPGGAWNPSQGAGRERQRKTQARTAFDERTKSRLQTFLSWRTRSLPCLRQRRQLHVYLSVFSSESTRAAAGRKIGRPKILHARRPSMGAIPASLRRRYKKPQ